MKQASEPVSVGHPVDNMTDLELMEQLVQFFGVGRASELMGWVIIAGLLSLLRTGGDLPALRRGMEERGMTKSTLYRALADFRRFGEHLEGRSYPSHNHEPTMHVLRRLSTVQAV